MWRERERKRGMEEGEREMNMYESNEKERRLRFREKGGQIEARWNKTTAHSALKSLPPYSRCNPHNRANRWASSPANTRQPRNRRVMRELAASVTGELNNNSTPSPLHVWERRQNILFIFSAAETRFIFLSFLSFLSSRSALIVS